MLFLGGIGLLILIAWLSESWKPVLIASAILGAIGYLIGLGLEMAENRYVVHEAPNLAVILALLPVGIAITMAKASVCYAIKLGIRALKARKATKSSPLSEHEESSVVSH